MVFEYVEFEFNISFLLNVLSCYKKSIWKSYRLNFCIYSHYKKLFTLLAIGFPMAVPCLLWNETVWNSFFISFVARLIYSLNFTWLVNSAAHIYGTRPFTKYVYELNELIIPITELGKAIVYFENLAKFLNLPSPVKSIHLFLIKRENFPFRWNAVHKSLIRRKWKIRRSVRLK